MSPPVPVDTAGDLHRCLHRWLATAVVTQWSLRDTPTVDSGVTDALEALWEVCEVADRVVRDSGGVPAAVVGLVRVCGDTAHRALRRSVGG